MRRIQSGQKGKSLESVTKRVLIPRNRALSARLGSSSSANDAESRLSSFTRLITSAELLASHSTAIELMPAEPGRGVLPVALSAYAGEGTTPYNIPGGFNLAVEEIFLSFGGMPSLCLMLAMGPPARASYDLFNTGNAAGAYADGPVTLLMGVDDPADGDFDITAELFYFQFPPVA